MIELILLANLFAPYTSIEFCNELKYETDRAVLRDDLTQQQSDAIFERCLETYTKGV